MPEYLAPGVYVEETSFRSKSIEGVSTTTTGFVGPTRYGPLDMEPDVITSLGEFERVYGDRQQLLFDQHLTHNFVWHAARAFFEEGGRRLYVVRVFEPAEDDDNEGRAHVTLPAEADPEAEDAITIRARFPGAAGNVRVRFTLQMGQNILTLDPATNRPLVNSLLDRDVVWLGTVEDLPTDPPGAAGNLYVANFNPQTRAWSFTNTQAEPATLNLRGDDEEDDLTPANGTRIHVVTLTIAVLSTDERALPEVWSNLPLDPLHRREGAADSFLERFAEHPSNRDRARTLPIVIEHGEDLADGVQVITALFDGADQDILTSLTNLASPLPEVRRDSTDNARSVTAVLMEGNDGILPTAASYEGDAPDHTTVRTGFRALEGIDDISIVAAPGATAGYEASAESTTRADTIIGNLIRHASSMRYRIAVLDSGDGQSIAAVRAMRAKFDSSYGAIYYPWVRILDPVTNAEVVLPPSGFVAGIYARNDINRAVYKAPANEVVNLAIGFERLLNKSQQEVLNPEGINCFRFFEGRGFRLWGARTISSDQEWKYVNLRRYFIYLEHSIDKGTQFAVFEPNGEALWANVRRTIEDFLLNEWQSGALLGDKPEKAYFVRCDRSTMTQNDLDNGRLICLIGVAPLRPAEFVIFRIGQFTADRKG